MILDMIYLLGMFIEKKILYEVIFCCYVLIETLTGHLIQKNNNLSKILTSEKRTKTLLYSL